MFKNNSTELIPTPSYFHQLFNQFVCVKNESFP